MQDPSTAKLQTPRINQRPNSTWYLLPLPNVLLHYASSVPDSSKKHPKYLNSETCSKLISSTQTSHSNPSYPPNTITTISPKTLTLTSFYSRLLIYILLIPFNSLPPTSYILGTCHSASLFTLPYAFSRSIKPPFTLCFFSFSFSPICFDLHTPCLL